MVASRLKDDAAFKFDNVNAQKKLLKKEIHPERYEGLRMTIDLPIEDPELRRRIKERAFEIWKAEGYPCGRDWAHWVQAEAEILSELKKGPKAQ